jgi:hypothetical protein
VRRCPQYPALSKLAILGKEPWRRVHRCISSDPLQVRHLRSSFKSLPLLSKRVACPPRPKTDKIMNLVVQVLSAGFFNPGNLILPSRLRRSIWPSSPCGRWCTAKQRLMQNPFRRLFLKLRQPKIPLGTVETQASYCLRFFQSSSINLALLALRKVVHARSAAQPTLAPYTDSKVTKILKVGLGRARCEYLFAACDIPENATRLVPANSNFAVAIARKCELCFSGKTAPVLALTESGIFNSGSPRVFSCFGKKKGRLCLGRAALQPL